MYQFGGRSAIEGAAEHSVGTQSIPIAIVVTSGHHAAHMAASIYGGCRIKPNTATESIGQATQGSISRVDARTAEHLSDSFCHYSHRSVLLRMSCPALAALMRRTIERRSRTHISGAIEDRELALNSKRAMCAGTLTRIAAHVLRGSVSVDAAADHAAHALRYVLCPRRQSRSENRLSRKNFTKPLF